MPVLGALPADPVIFALRGKIDFYYWRGIPVARKWPRGKDRRFTPANIASAALFGQLAHDIVYIGAAWYDAAVEMTAGDRWTWRDYVTTLAYAQNVEW